MSGVGPISSFMVILKEKINKLVWRCIDKLGQILSRAVLISYV